MHRLFSFLMIILLGACAQINDNTYKRKNVTSYYIAAGYEKYLLPGIPTWANFSKIGACNRKKSIQYIELSEYMRSFSLKYEEAIQFQLKINNKFTQYQDSVRSDFLIPKNKEQLFFEANDEIQSGVYDFKAPVIDLTHLVWIDPALTNPKAMKKLKKLLKREDFFVGHPVFVSNCLTQKQLENFLIDNKFNDIDIRLVGVELFSIFNLKGEREPKFQLHINEILKPKSKVYLYSFNGQEFDELVGKYHVRKY